VPELLGDIFSFVEAIAEAAAVNGLAQLLLKLTAPGVPDIYQGSEYWDFSLVDPDNRRPVDFDRRRASLPDDGTTFARWRVGAVKQSLIRRTLGLRAFFLPSSSMADTSRSLREGCARTGRGGIPPSP
jgi:(1->4)-alpha-D-glucan 1-alpha-D-glucosylmutase